MFIDSTIFKGELHLVFNRDSNNCISTTQLDWFIDEYESDILQSLLGQLYFELVEAKEAGLIVSGSKWEKLLDGAIYEIDGEKYKWKGLKYLIACFIYLRFVNNQSILVTKAGGKIPEFELANNVSIKEKAVLNWNKATKLTKPSHCSRAYYDYFYGDYVLKNFKGNTLLHFLSNNDFENYCVEFYDGGMINGYR